MTAIPVMKKNLIKIQQNVGFLSNRVLGGFRSRWIRNLGFKFQNSKWLTQYGYIKVFYYSVYANFLNSFSSSGLHIISAILNF